MLKADIKNATAAENRRQRSRSPDPKKLFEIGKEMSDARRGGVPLEDQVQTPKTPPDECKAPQELFVRRDKMDTFLYGITAVSKAQGASIAYTGDQADHVRDGQINGSNRCVGEGTARAAASGGRRWTRPIFPLLLVAP